MPKHFYEEWCDTVSTDISGHKLHRLVEKQNVREKLQPQIITVVQSHYEDPKRLIARTKRLGLPKAAAFLEAMIPQSKVARSGHLGEILATEVIPTLLPPFQIAIKRLRWLDGRESAMRGEDSVGFSIDKKRVRFLKGESKSRAALASAVVAEARVALKANNGRPSQHAMGFIVERLMDQNKNDLALVFEEYMLEKSIPIQDMVHILFAFSGNDGCELLKEDLKGYSGKAEQHSVNLIVDDHQAFIKSIYEKWFK